MGVFPLDSFLRSNEATSSSELEVKTFFVEGIADGQDE
jgi:hypothetical protein